jgi:methyl-accepting chemotaxis protein
MGREDESIPVAIHHLADSISELAGAMGHLERQPKWAKRLEAKVSALADALVELGAATDEVISELEDMAAQIEANGDVAAAAQQIRDTAQRLRDAQPDAPAPGGGDTPAPGGGDTPPADGGDTPPAPDNPPA